MFRHLKCHHQGAHFALLQLHIDFWSRENKVVKIQNDKLQ